MDYFAFDIDICGAFPMGRWPVGILGISEASNAWRLRSSEALDGDHDPFASVDVYFYDLPYWGLDYPPLTAYHSWICGKM